MVAGERAVFCRVMCIFLSAQFILFIYLFIYCSSTSFIYFLLHLLLIVFPCFPVCLLLFPVVRLIHKKGHVASLVFIFRFFSFISLHFTIIINTDFIILFLFYFLHRHAAVDWDQHYRWSRGLMKEFFSQGKQEAELGLPISPVCNEFSTDVPKSQVGFIKMLCQPLFAGLSHIDPSGRIEAVCVSQLIANSATWQRVSDLRIDWKDAERVKRQRQVSVAVPT